tara:strand:+ start:9099 stop:9683 length:585 start_codon:yes stop_codon:yes gene_type:complete
MKHPELENYLNQFGKQLVNKAKGILQRTGKGGGNLEKSIRFEVTDSPDGMTQDISFYMEDYGAYVDAGVSGAGGEIKSGKHKGNYSGKQTYKNYKDAIVPTPFRYGSGKGKKNGIYKGIGSFIRKKNMQPRNEKGQYQTTVGLKIAIVKVLWTKGIKGVEFFQKPMSLGLKEFKGKLLTEITKDILAEINTQIK